MMFAGLFSVWKGEEGKEVGSFSIITTSANELMARIHQRMPVILPPEAYERWLDRSYKDTDELQRLLRPYPEEEMEAWPVSKAVNNSRNDGPECLEPVRE